MAEETQGSSKRSGRATGATWLVLALFAALYLALAVSSYRQKSATWDEPFHLAAGYGVLKSGDYRIDAEHPPLIRMWAALPLVATRGVRLETGLIGQPDAYTWHGRNFFFGFRFLYQDNDASQLLNAGRFMIVLLGLGLGVVVFFWSRQLYGFGPAAAALALYCLEPNGLAHARLVTTDFGFAALACLTLFFLWRVCRELTPGNLAGLIVAFGLTVVSKFTVAGLIPIVGVLLLIRAVRGASWPFRGRRDGELGSRARRLSASAAILLLLAVAGIFSIWACYGFRHAPSEQPGWYHAYDELPMTIERTPTTAALARWIDDRHLLPEAYVQGFLVGQVKAQRRSSYLMGDYSTEGWWYYFPVAFAVKTPVSLLVLFAAAVLAAAARRRRFLDDELYLFLPIALFFGMAMASNLNIGIRHLLVVFPLAIVAGARAVGLFWQEGRKLGRIVLALLGLILVWEHAAAYPHYLPFFNQLIGGPRNGHAWLVDSNLDWGQDLPALARWMEEESVDSVSLSYFGMADPAYYGIDAIHTVGAPGFALDRVELPRTPGWLAISATHASGVYLTEDERRFFAPLLELEPDHVLGHSLWLYRVERPWW